MITKYIKPYFIAIKYGFMYFVIIINIKKLVLTPI